MLLLPRWPKPIFQFAYIEIVNLLLIEHKIVYIKVSLDIFVVDTIP